MILTKHCRERRKDLAAVGDLDGIVSTASLPQVWGLLHVGELGLLATLHEARLVGVGLVGPRRPQLRHPLLILSSLKLFLRLVACRCGGSLVAFFKLGLLGLLGFFDEDYFRERIRSWTSRLKRASVVGAPMLLSFICALL